MDGYELLGPFERLLTEVCTPEAVRRVQAEGSGQEMYAAFSQSGFLDALVPEDREGAGLSFGDVCPLIQALGRFAVPVPVAETMVARMLLAEADQRAPHGWITLSSGASNLPAPLARVANYSLTEQDGDMVLSSTSPSDPLIYGGLAAWLHDGAKPLLKTTVPPHGLRTILAVLRACIIAGAADRILAMTISYANDRVQFGKPISKQQVIQQQIAVLAELAVVCRLAAQIGCSDEGLPSPSAAAIAKYMTSAAAGDIASIAHAVHGAIGFSEEFDLQIYTRRLNEERLADGSEAYWARELGQSRLTRADLPTVDFVRLHLHN